MKRFFAKFFMWLFYIIISIVALKWGLYDSIINLKMGFWNCLLLPFIILLKWFACFFVLMALLSLNSYLFTNAFKE